MPASSLEPRPITTRIEQKRIDALCARILHEAALRRLRRFSVLIDVLALTVPIFYMAARLLAKGTSYESAAQSTWECIAAALLILVVIKMALRWSDRSEQHSKLIGQNISLSTQANYLLSKAPPDTDAAQSFFLYSDLIEIADRDSLGNPGARRKKYIYREALKEIGPDVICPVCKSSPWHYTRGSCQACGNTAVSKEK
jgi:mobilome CxxCx(11)CxxC protein